MARSVRNPKLDTRSARSRLPTRKSPYWAPISPGFAVGYRKGTKGGVWLAKYASKEIRSESRLGPADDHLDADGLTALNFAQAQEKAREWVSRIAQKANGDNHVGPYSVTDAVTDYLDWFKVHRKSVRETEYNFRSYVLPVLGSVEVSKLTARRLREWHHSISDMPPRLRTRKGEKQKYRDTSGDPEAKRRRRSTANHVLANLKAALNHAWHEGKVGSDEPWRRVKPFANVDAARVRYLQEDECVRLINACDEEFRPLVLAALYSGCRYGELTSLRVHDFNVDAGTLLIRESKSGKPRQVVLAEKGRRFFETHTAGRQANEIIFRRQDGRPWGKSHQIRRLKEACKNGSILPEASFHILRHTYASHLVMNGAPLNVVASNLGHSDTRMVEKHYAHLTPSYIANAIRSAATALDSSLPQGQNDVYRFAAS